MSLTATWRLRTARCWQCARKFRPRCLVVSFPVGSGGAAGCRVRASVQSRGKTGPPNRAHGPSDAARPRSLLTRGSRGGCRSRGPSCQGVSGHQPHDQDLSRGVADETQPRGSAKSRFWPLRNGTGSAQKTNTLGDLMRLTALKRISQHESSAEHLVTLTCLLRSLEREQKWTRGTGPAE